MRVTLSFSELGYGYIVSIGESVFGVVEVNLPGMEYLRVKGDLGPKA